MGLVGDGLHAGDAVGLLLMMVTPTGQAGTLASYNQPASSIDNVHLNLSEGVAQTDIQPRNSLRLAQQRLMPAEKGKGGGAHHQENCHRNDQFEKGKALRHGFSPRK